MKLDPKTAMSISAEFQRFIQNIETNQQVYVKLGFTSLNELETSTAHFFERAIARSELSPRFAEAAQKLYFLAPPAVNGEVTNFRKAIINESQRQIEQLGEKINTASNLTLEKALGIVKFFGELYNVGFLFKGILKKHLEIFHASKDDCFFANRCFYLLIDTVKEKVRKVYETPDYTIVIVSLIKMIDEAERNPAINEKPKVAIPRAPVKATAPKTFEEQFPTLNKNTAKGVLSDSIKNIWEDKVASFQRLLEDLTTSNTQEILKKFGESQKHRFEDGTWQLYYDILINKALSEHELAEAVVDICQKLPRCAEAWQGVKTEEYKKYIHQLINAKLETIFEESNVAARKKQIVSILVLIQKLLEHSQTSIGDIAAFIKVLTGCAKSDNVLASQIILQLLVIIKRKISTAKIRKLPVEQRMEIIQVVSSGQSGKLTEKIKNKIKEIAEYIDVEYIVDDFPFPKAANGHLTHDVIAMDIKANGNGFASSPVSSVSSCISSPGPSQLSAFDNFRSLLPFDYSFFIDELAANGIDTMKAAIQRESVNRDWDLSKLAETLFEKSLIDGDHSTYARLSVKINEATKSLSSKSFEELLTNVALRALGIELSFNNIVQLDSDRTAISTAEFLSELYKTGWVTNNYLFRCMDEIAKTEFDTVRRIKIFRALVKSAAMKMMKNRCDDRFIFYTQMIRARAGTMTDSKSHLLCMELLELLENITMINNNSPQSYAIHNNKTTKIVHVMGKINFGNPDETVTTIKALPIANVDELNCLVDIVVRQAMVDTEHVVDYAKLSVKFDGLSVPVLNAPSATFKILLTNRCQHKLHDFVEGGIEATQVAGTYNLVHFISELYKMEIISQEFIQLCMDVFFKKEASCMHTVYCVNMMMRTVGPTLERRNIIVLNHYFDFFEFTVKRNEKSYRSLVYGKLLEFRKNKWEIPKEPESPTKKAIELKSLVVDIPALTSRAQIFAMGEALKKHLTTVERVGNFIKGLLDRSIIDHQQISNCVKLFKELADITASEANTTKTFKDVLIETLNKEFVISNSKRNLDEAGLNSFASFVVMVGDLYRQDVFTNDDLHTWLLHKHIAKVPLHHLTYLSSIVAPKIQLSGRKQLQTILGMLDATIHDLSMEICFKIQDDIREVLLYTKQFEDNNPQSPESADSLFS